MAKIGIIVCLVVVVRAVVACLLGIEAFFAKNTVHTGDTNEATAYGCEDGSFELGLAASILLALAHVTSNLLNGCMCTSSMEELERSSANRKIWFACLIFSWIIMAIGFPLLIMGTLESSRSRRSCKFFHHHFRSVGGISCFVHGLLCIALYVSATVNCGNGSPN